MVFRSRIVSPVKAYALLDRHQHNWRRKALRWQFGVWEAGMTNLLTTPAPLPTRERLGRLSHSFLAGTVADDLKQFVSSSRPAEVERNAIVQGR